MSTDDLKTKIFNEIDKFGYFLYSPSKWIEYGEVINQLVNDKILIGLDQIPSTKNYMNSPYLYTYSDNRFNLQIKCVETYTHSIVKGKELTHKFKKEKK